MNLEQKRVSTAKLDIFVLKLSMPTWKVFYIKTKLLHFFATFSIQRMNVSDDDLAVYSILKTYPWQLQNGHLLLSTLTYSTIYFINIVKQCNPHGCNIIKGVRKIQFCILILKHCQRHNGPRVFIECITWAVFQLKSKSWNLVKILKLGQNLEIWLKSWNLVKILKFGQNSEIWSKSWNLLEILKFGWNPEIWLKSWNLVKS